jgi:hypothetical protein
MRGYGLDRQFRGAIRGLQLFGSRVSGRGALDQATLEGLLSAGPVSVQPSPAARSAPLLAAATAPAKDRPPFGGPTGQGHSTETGLPLTGRFLGSLSAQTKMITVGTNRPESG